MKIIITGSQGFIGSYLCNEFLNNGYEVIGVDNYSKYGILKRSHDDHPNFKLHIGDICESSWFESLCEWKKPDFIIAGAALCLLKHFIISSVLTLGVVPPFIISCQGQRFE